MLVTEARIDVRRDLVGPELRPSIKRLATALMDRSELTGDEAGQIAFGGEAQTEGNQLEAPAAQELPAPPVRSSGDDWAGVLKGLVWIAVIVAAVGVLFSLSVRVLLAIIALILILLFLGMFS